MAGVFSRFKRAAKATVALSQSHTYQTEGQTVKCSHCDFDLFDQAVALLNTAGMTLFKLDWANRSATILICQKCGHIQWFLKEPNKIRPSIANDQ